MEISFRTLQKQSFKILLKSSDFNDWPDTRDAEAGSL